jgi:glycosyltransferase involved in cell wall biosynthesis
MNVGGAETFLMKVYRQLDKTKYQMDFAVGISEKGHYDDEIIALGGSIYHVTPKSKGIIQNFSSIKKIVKENRYQYVLRTSQHSLSALELLAAKIGGAKTRVFRSSNANDEGGTVSRLLQKIFAFMPKYFANVRIAPSTEAAEFVFGKNCIKNGKAQLLHNGIDLSIYHYSETDRQNIRKEFNITEDAFVVGHVGRFQAQKNHLFLLEIFSRVCKENENALLLLVGKGKLEENIREKAKELGILNHIIFTGVRSDVPALLSAMDVFVFPSLYEGMPNTVIEAQATGLPCIISDTITKEANVTGLVSYLPLEHPSSWGEMVINSVQKERFDTRAVFQEAGYDIQSVTEHFVKLIFGE